MNLVSLAKGCAECRACEGAAYQTPPVLYAGTSIAPIIAIGQNPGEIKSSDKARQSWMRIFERATPEVLNDHMSFWYQWDFFDSHGYRQLEKIFGNNWLFEGKIMWTNAVRCRTKNNERPPEEMFGTCKTWTEQLISGRKAIIMVGGYARLQVLGDQASKLEWGTPKKHPRLGYILAIKHYAAWRGTKEIEVYKKAVKKLKEHAL